MRHSSIRGRLRIGQWRADKIRRGAALPQNDLGKERRSESNPVPISEERCNRQSLQYRAQTNLHRRDLLTIFEIIRLRETKRIVNIRGQVVIDMKKCFGEKARRLKRRVARAVCRSAHGHHQSEPSAPSCWSAESRCGKACAFWRAELPGILATRTDTLSPLMLRLLEDLLADWRRLDARIEGLSTRSKRWLVKTKAASD